MLQIGITGTMGAGKNAVADYLVHKYQFEFCSGSGVLAKEVSRRGLPLTRENLRDTANELRNTYGNACLVDLLFKEKNKNDDIVIGFFRTVGEIKRFRELFPSAMVIAVDAPIELRYVRICERAEEKDKVSFEKFQNQEMIESESKNPSSQNIQACMKIADFMINNNRSIEDLYKEVDDALEILKNKK